MRHRSRTGSRAGKQNTPKVDFASAFGVLFCLYGDGSVPKERAACIHWMQFGKGLGSSQQAFLRGAGRTRCKKRDLVPGRTACTLHAHVVRSASLRSSLQRTTGRCSRLPFTWRRSKQKTILLAMLQANELLLHLTPAARTELIGFAHSICQGSHPCSCRQPAASGRWIPARFSAHPWRLWHPRWPFWIPACRWPSQRP